MDMTALLSQVLESKLSGLMYQNMAPTQGRRYVPSSTRRAFDSQMRGDAGQFRQSAQNMRDAMSMVTTAQTGVTSIKAQLTEMHKMATELATLDLSDEQYKAYSSALKEQSTIITGLANNLEFNGIPLLNGKGGMNGDGTVVLQGGGNAMNQEFTNLLSVKDPEQVLNADGSMNFNALERETSVTDKAEAQALVNNLDSYIQRLDGIEANYSFDIKSFENLSVMYENNADIFENTIQYKQEDEVIPEGPSSASYLEQLMGVNTSNGSIFSDRS